MTKAEKLQSLKRRLEDNPPTPELAKSAIQIVFGSGNVDADILFVGEAPGRNEDEQGEPFVGASGRILDEQLTNAGLSRDEVYVTNIIKFRPPDNRDPSDQEKTESMSHLLEQIAIIKPKVIATLGRHSSEVLIPGLVMSEAHGKPQKVKLLLDNKETNVIVLPLYHPAAIIYNRTLRAAAYEDMKIAAKLIQKNTNNN